MAKSKPMKRLPPNWGDKLWDSDIDEILAHWTDCLRHYEAIVAEKRLLGDFYATRYGSDADVMAMRSRVALWTACRDARAQGRSLMPLLRADRQSR